MTSIFELQGLRADLAATSLFEWFATALGIVYILLIMRRNRWGWVAGGASSLILTVLAARARLPMQALLQFSYVLAALYGWWRWRGANPQLSIGLWPWPRHLLAVGACVLAALALAPWLRATGNSDWPFLDPLIAFLGLFASWLTARVRLENWIYWMFIDTVSLYLFTAQGHPVIALLFLVYFGISCAGLRSWWRLYRAQPNPA